MRELLNRLSSEGLVMVSPVSGTNLREVAAMRLLLEGHALAQSFDAGEMEWEGRVVAAHHKLGPCLTTPCGARPRALWRC
jgi:DNA-binding GntR family transcriptional regulator